MQAIGAGTWPLPLAPPGQQAYTTAGTYSWVAPTNVIEVSVVCVGGGGGGNVGVSGSTYYSPGCGGALAYANNIAVVPGNSYTVIVGAGGAYTTSGGDSSFNTNSCKAGGGKVSTYPTAPTPGAVINGTGGSGGGPYLPIDNGWCRSDFGGAGGGGAGGYSGAGGTGGFPTGGGDAGVGGAGGGGASSNSTSGGGGGGGVGLLGSGTSGAGGDYPGGVGRGGSSGSNASGGTGGLYGGGGNGQGNGAGGAVRIIWGNTIVRAFPSTNTGNL